MKLNQFITRIFFPKKCSLCGKIIPITNDFCNCCNEDAVVIGNDFCDHCGYDSNRCTCHHKDTIRFSHITAVYIYSGVIRQKICAFKFEREKHLYKHFAMKMSERIAIVYPEIDFDFVTFVPTTKKVIKQRGFNQSELLAKEIAKNFFIDCSDVLVKTKETSSQHNLKAEQRTANLYGSIICNTDLSGKTVLLCDDVKTTGTTLNECVKALKKNGAKDIYCVCIALSDYNRDIF